MVPHSETKVKHKIKGRKLLHTNDLGPRCSGPDLSRW
ncbi:uncharacterized protein METZ01_LOCUS137064 [marine metagenome]|uniref:Uncharacterized protein n=1 Tax=marine metagenome TaxID=408172 RepID=A0A381Z4R5_9ZZZZ